MNEAEALAARILLKHNVVVLKKKYGVVQLRRIEKGESRLLFWLLPGQKVYDHINVLVGCDSRFRGTGLEALCGCRSEEEFLMKAAIVFPEEDENEH